MPSTATVTGKVGPGLTATAVVLTGVTEMFLDCEKEVLFIKTNGQMREFDVSADTTWTLTVSGNTYTLTVS